MSPVGSGARRAALLGALAFAALLPRVGSAAEVEARLDRSAMTVGETTALEVTVRGAPLGVDAPEFTLPDGLEVLGTGRARNFTFMNGKSSIETIFRFELSASAPGHYGIGPIAVHVGKEIFRSGVLTLDVTAAAQRIGGGGAGSSTGGSSGAPASLLVDVSPAEPWVGQPCVMRVRLVQRAPLAEDPQYTPPATPGFWTDRTSPPESYFADEHGRRVLVTETRTRLYPLAPGSATVGEAVASLALAGGDNDPRLWPGGQVPRREVTVRSQPAVVRVRALPASAPSGFAGAVGDFSVRWSADRSKTSVDVPVTVRLDLRGRGNLPLIRPPDLSVRDLEMFASTVDDSLASPGNDAAGRKRFQWTVLARRTGRLLIPAPSFAWFDPGSGAYRVAQAPAIALDVGPPLFTGADNAELPSVFTRHPLDPGAREAGPWAWSLAGLLIGIGLALWRMGGGPGRATAARAQALEWLRAVGRASGPDFWRAADEASGWLASRGRAIDAVRREIAAARFGGAGRDVEAIRRHLVEEISAALPAKASALPRRAVAILLIVLGVGAAVGFGPRPGDPRLAARVVAGDQAAREGDVGRARTQWASVWDGGARPPGLAARLAWAESRSGAIGPAATWVLRGELEGGRDPALAWVSDRVREGGGLVGDPQMRWPVRPLEWAVGALLFGVVGGALWPRRRWAIACGLAALVLGFADPVWTALGSRDRRAVVQESVTIEGTGLDLQPGQVVRVIARRGDRMEIDAGGGVSGSVPGGALEIVGGP